MSIPSRFLDWDLPIGFAHRGGAIDAPENSKAAFQESIDLGYSYLETDVHLTKDGRIVAFHDDELDRVTNSAGKILDLDFAEIGRAKIDGREPIPLMEDLLTTWPDKFWNIDAKSAAVVEPLVDLIGRLGVQDRVCLASFSDKRIEIMRGGLPGVATNVGSRSTGHLRAYASKLAPRPSISGECAQVPASFKGVPIVTQRFVECCHDLDLAVHVWTINDPSEMHRLLNLGVDGIMTDRPATLRGVLESRDQWSAMGPTR